MRSLTLALSFALLSIPAHAADTTEAAAEQAARKELLRHWAGNVLQPMTQEFAAAAGKLAESSEAFCAGKRDLRQVQAAWRDAESAWQPLEMLQIGPTIERRTQRQVNFWPVRPRLMEPILSASAPIPPEDMETLGAAGKGLPAMEYLLFPDDKTAGDAKKTFAAGYCHALQALANHVRTEAEGLAAEWRAPDGGFARQLAEAGEHPQDGAFTSTDQALSDVVNLLIAGLDAVKIRKLGKPLEKSEDTASLERIESWRSGASLDHIRDNLRGFERVFFGAGSDEPGLDDYLATIQRPGLARVIRQELDAAKTALAAIRPPMQNAVIKQRKQVENLHKTVGRLQYLLETEVADALKVDLGFNANDGD